MPALFGPAGNSDSYSAKYKSSMQVPEFLSEAGLDAYEYQCGKGVKTGQETAVKFGISAKKYDIKLVITSYSIHYTKLYETTSSRSSPTALPGSSTPTP